MCAGWYARYAITPHSVTPTQVGAHESFNALSVGKNKRMRHLRSNWDTAFAVSLMGPDLRRDDEQGGVWVEGKETRGAHPQPHTPSSRRRHTCKLHNAPLATDKQ